MFSLRDTELRKFDYLMDKKERIIHTHDIILTVEFKLFFYVYDMYIWIKLTIFMVFIILYYIIYNYILVPSFDGLFLIKNILIY